MHDIWLLKLNVRDTDRRLVVIELLARFQQVNGAVPDETIRDAPEHERMLIEAALAPRTEEQRPVEVVIFKTCCLRGTMLLAVAGETDTAITLRRVDNMGEAEFFISTSYIPPEEQMPSRSSSPPRRSGRRATPRLHA
ncbi:MAG: hypothetical protein AAB865_03245 [Patescibacteria group bacterium]